MTRSRYLETLAAEDHAKKLLTLQHNTLSTLTHNQIYADASQATSTLIPPLANYCFVCPSKTFDLDSPIHSTHLDSPVNQMARLILRFPPKSAENRKVTNICDHCRSYKGMLLLPVIIRRLTEAQQIGPPSWQLTSYEMELSISQ